MSPEEPTDPLVCFSWCRRTSPSVSRPQPRPWSWSRVWAGGPAAVWSSASWMGSACPGRCCWRFVLRVPSTTWRTHLTLFKNLSTFYKGHTDDTCWWINGEQKWMDRILDNISVGLLLSWERHVDFIVSLISGLFFITAAHVGLWRWDNSLSCGRYKRPWAEAQGLYIQLHTDKRRFKTFVSNINIITSCLACCVPKFKVIADL